VLVRCHFSKSRSPPSFRCSFSGLPFQGSSVCLVVGQSVFWRGSSRGVSRGSSSRDGTFLFIRNLMRWVYDRSADGFQGEALLAESHEILIRKLREHSRLSRDDLTEIYALSYTTRALGANEDLIRQGDDPSVSALVITGMVARYHLLPNGRRQYLSFHMAGDMPDSQALFIDKMDHAICALGPALIACLPHKEIIPAFNRRPPLGFAIWRETLIDAAIFREAITNNSARTMPARMAHLFCELLYRARASNLTNDETCQIPIELTQLGETLGMSIATVNRTLQELRTARVADLRNGVLSVRNWRKLAEIGQFDPGYLHLKKPQA